MGYETWEDGKRQPAADFVIRGERIDRELLRRLSSLRIEGNEGRSTIATVQFRDPDMAFIDSVVFAMGTTWEIELGWLGDLVEMGTFVVATCTPDFPDSGVPSITIQLKDLKQPLAAYAKWRKFEGTSVRDLVQAVTQDHGLDFEVDADDGAWLKEFTVRNPIMQNGVSDDELLRRTAARFGYLYQVEGTTVRFTRAFMRRDVGTRVLAWRIGSRNLANFKPSQKDLKPDGIGAGFTSSGGSTTRFDVDPKTGAVSLEEKPADSRATNNDVSRQDGAVTQTEVAANASKLSFIRNEAGEEGSRERKTPETSAAKTTEPADTTKDSGQLADVGTKDVVDAEGELTIADPTFRLGNIAEVIGVGMYWSGRYRVVSFLHELLEDSFRTQLGFGRKMLGASDQTEEVEAGKLSDDPDYWVWTKRYLRNKTGEQFEAWEEPIPGARLSEEEAAKVRAARGQ